MYLRLNGAKRSLRRQPRALRRQPRCSLRSRGGDGGGGGWGCGRNLLMQAIADALNDVVLPRFGSLLRNIAGGASPLATLGFLLNYLCDDNEIINNWLGI